MLSFTLRGNIIILDLKPFISHYTVTIIKLLWQKPTSQHNFSVGDTSCIEPAYKSDRFANWRNPNKPFERNMHDFYKSWTILSLRKQETFFSRTGQEWRRLQTTHALICPYFAPSQLSNVIVFPLKFSTFIAFMSDSCSQIRNRKFSNPFLRHTTVLPTAEFIHWRSLTTKTIK